MGRRGFILKPSACLGRVLGRTALALVFAGPAAGVRAAPGQPQEPVCEGQPTLDEARLITGRDLSLRAEEHFAARRYRDAVRAWEQVLVLMPGNEAELRVPLAHAHVKAYLAEGGVDHLKSARQLFGRQLESLEPDADARAVIQAELADVQAMQDALEQAERQAQERRDEQIRREALARLEAQRREDLHRQQATIRKFYYGLGGSLVGLGAGSLAAMTAFLVSGARLDREGRQMAAMTGVEDGTYQSLLVRGQTYNQAAVATGVVGGVFAAVGGSLVVVAAIRRRQQKKPVAVAPAPGGVQLQF